MTAAGGSAAARAGEPAPAAEFDPYSSSFFDDPYPVYRRLRDEAPLYHSERYDFWALSRFADVVAAHRDWQSFSSRGAFEQVPGDDSGAAVGIIGMDPPEHDRMRALVSRVFTPRAVQALEPMVREVITGFLDGLSGASAFDGVGDLAAPFPVEIISRMLGVPAGDRQRIREWTDLMLHREPGSERPTPEGLDAGIACGTYLYQLVVDKRSHPGDDMLTRLLDVEVVREDGHTTRLDDVEITAFATLLGAAGSETVTKLVGNAIVLFARHPDQWQTVLSDPSVITGAVEEVLRYWPPSQYQNRIAAKPIVLHDRTIPAGARVFLLTGAATRDEREFTDPDAFDIGRGQSLSIAFGHGLHSCLGAALARMETRIAIEEWARRWPRYAIDEHGLERVHMTNVAGYSRVPVSV